MNATDTGLMAFSYSRFNTFDRCPLWFRLRYIDRIPEADSAPLVTGRIAHEVAEAYGKHCIGNGVATDFAFFDDLARRACSDAPAEVGADLRGILDTMRDTISFIEGPASRIEEELAFDREWRPVAWDDPAVFFRAKIDKRMTTDEGVIVWDLKTDRRIPPASDLPTNPQLRIYAYLVTLLDPDVQSITVVLFFGRYGRSQSWTFTREEAESYGKEIERKAERIEVEMEWTPRLGEACRICPYTARCEAFQSAYAGMDFLVRDEEHARELAARREAVGAAYDLLTESLKAHVEAHGRIALPDGRVLDFVPGTKVTFEDVRAVVAFLRKELGDDLAWAALSTTKTQVTKVIRKAKRKDLIDAALALGTETPTTTFKIAKKGEEGEEG